MLTCVDGLFRIARASIIEVDRQSLVCDAYPHQSGALVYIDTAHTEFCLDGGDWITQTGNPRELVRSKQGRLCYTVPGGSERLDDRAAWHVGIMLLSPGDSIEVHFKAPGRLAGLLTCSARGALTFEFTAEEIDRSYVWVSPDYALERLVGRRLAPLRAGS